MPTSDWDDWLIKAVSTADPETVALWYLGCNGAIIKDREGTTIFIDPYLGTGDPPRTVRMIPVPFAPTAVETMDALFVTHEHTDHVHEPTQRPLLARTDGDMYGPAASLAVTDSWDIQDKVAADQFNEVAPGTTVELGAFTVHVESANDPDANEPVSYVFEHPTGTLFHGGDARPGEAFAEIGRQYDIDVGLLAFGSAGMIPDKQTGEPTYTKWYSDENEIIKAARQLQLDRLVPTHWDMWRGLTADPKALHEHAASFDFPQRVDITRIGDRVDL